MMHGYIILDSQYSGKSGRSQTPSLMEFLKNQDLATCADIDKVTCFFQFKLYKIIYMQIY